MAMRCTRIGEREREGESKSERKRARETGREMCRGMCPGTRPTGKTGIVASESSDVSGYLVVGIAMLTEATKRSGNAQWNEAMATELVTSCDLPVKSLQQTLCRWLYSLTI